MVAFEEITKAPYFSQALVFLHVLWSDGSQQEAVKVWSYTQVFTQFDPKKTEGNELDHQLSLDFLKYTADALSTEEAEKKLKQIDITGNGKLALIEYLVYRFKKTVADVEAARPGTEEAVVSEIASALQAVLPSLGAEAAVNVATISVEIANKAYLELVGKTDNTVDDADGEKVPEPEYLINAKESLFAAFRDVDKALKELSSKDVHAQAKALADAEEVVKEVRASVPSSPSEWWLEHEIAIAKEHTK